MVKATSKTVFIELFRMKTGILSGILKKIYKLCCSSSVRLVMESGWVPRAGFEESSAKAKIEMTSIGLMKSQDIYLPFSRFLTSHNIFQPYLCQDITSCYVLIRMITHPHKQFFTCSLP